MNSNLLISEFFSKNNYYSALSSVNSNQYHRHEFIEILYIISGSAIQKLNDIESVVSVGEVYILRPSDWHNFSKNNQDHLYHRDLCIIPEEFNYICNYICPDFFNYLNKSTDVPKFTISIEDLQYFESFFKRFINNESLQDAESAYRTITTQILFLLYSKYFKQSNFTPDWIEQLYAQLNTPYLLNQNLNDIIKDIPYSLPYISTTFKKHIGITMTKCFSNARLNYAKFLLLTTDYTAENIAEIVGYNSLSHFYRDFKKYFGSTPNKIRK